MSPAEISKLGDSFFAWYRSRHGELPICIEQDDLHEWADANGLKFSAKTFAVFASILSKELDRRLSVIFALKNDSSPRYPWTDFLLKMTADEKHRSEVCRSNDEWDDDMQHRRQSEQQREDTRRRTTLASNVHLSPAFVDRSMKADLELKLLTNNIASEDVPEVLQFLANLRQELNRAMAKRD